MRRTTSFRLDRNIKETITRAGGASFVEGCVLLVSLAGLTALARKAALEYESSGHPPISALSLSSSLESLRLSEGKVLSPLPASNQIDLSNVIAKVSDIPSDLDPDYRRAIESLLATFGEREDLNI